MSTQSSLDPDVQESFEETLASGLGMARKRLPIQTALSKHKRRFLKLKSEQRQELAAALRWEYRRRSSRVGGNERALQLLNERYSKFQCFVTPIHRLPAEILMEIFYIVLDIQQALIKVILVCHRWHTVVEMMTGLEVPLELGTWTVPEIVKCAVSSEFRNRLLNVTVHTNRDR